MNDNTIIAGVTVILLAVGGFLYYSSPAAKPVVEYPATINSTSSAVVDRNTPEAKLAQCLKDSGVVFYGAFWCPHCQKQKADFGAAESLLPYVECTVPPEGKTRTQICIDKKVDGYPTWEFSDGTRVTGAQTLIDLAKKASCAYPGVDVALPSSKTVSAPIPAVLPAGGATIPAAPAKPVSI